MYSTFRVNSFELCTCFFFAKCKLLVSGYLDLDEEDCSFRRRRESINKVSLISSHQTWPGGDRIFEGTDGIVRFGLSAFLALPRT